MAVKSLERTVKSILRLMFMMNLIRKTLFTTLFSLMMLLRIIFKFTLDLLRLNILLLILLRKGPLQSAVCTAIESSLSNTSNRWCQQIGSAHSETAVIHCQDQLGADVTSAESVGFFVAAFSSSVHRCRDRLKK